MATPEIQVPQAGLILAVRQKARETLLPQGGAFSVYNVPADEIQTTFGGSNVVYRRNSQELRLTQSTLMAVVRGKIDTPKLKTFGFNLDAHGFYFIRLGSSGKTLVYDLYTNTFSWWSKGVSPSLNILSGINWRSSGGIASNFGSNILVGDASNGSLYIMDPYTCVDSSQYEDVIPFPREASAQMPIRGRSHDPVFSVYLTADLGEPAYEGATVKLSYSDDQGRSFVDSTSIEVRKDDFGQEIFWRSLGSIRPPGRIFKITDDGALTRVDSLDVNIE